jgi:uracil-DNA glycosylase
MAEGIKPLLIGEAPGPNGDPGNPPLDGRSAVRLLECMGFQPKGRDAYAKGAVELGEMFDVRNLLDRPIERPEGEKGCEWPKEEAEAAANRLAVLVERGQRVVFLGKRVASAFPAVDARTWWHWNVLGGEWSVAGIAYVTIPHPSGIVRTWNDPVNRVRAGMVLWQALGKIDARVGP